MGEGRRRGILSRRVREHARRSGAARARADKKQTARWASALNRSGRRARGRRGARGKLPSAAQFIGRIGALGADVVCGDLRRVGQPGDQEGSRLADEFGGGHGLDRGAFEGVTDVVAVSAGVRWGCVMMGVIVVMIVTDESDFQPGFLQRAVQGRRQPEGQEYERNEAAETGHGEKRGVETRACQGTWIMACAKRPRAGAESSRQSFFLLLNVPIRQGSGSERRVGRSERIRERGKRRMTVRATDFDAALNGGLGAGPRKCAGG